MRLLVCAILLVLAAHVSCQNVIGVDTLGRRPSSSTAVTRCFGDSLCTSFVIVIPEGVPLHKHVKHSEHVLILEGEAEMRLGDSTLLVRKGDLVFIPKNTEHSVTTKSKTPLRVLSLQAPLFDGSDRVMVK